MLHERLYGRRVDNSLKRTYTIYIYNSTDDGKTSVPSGQMEIIFGLLWVAFGHELRSGGGKRSFSRDQINQPANIYKGGPYIYILVYTGCTAMPIFRFPLYTITWGKHDVSHCISEMDWMSEEILERTRTVVVSVAIDRTHNNDVHEIVMKLSILSSITHRTFKSIIFPENNKFSWQGPPQSW